MIALGAKGATDAAKDALATVLDLRKLAMHLHRRAHHFAAARLSNGLMAERDQKDGRQLCAEREADARFIWRAWARRDHQSLGVHPDYLINRDLVVAEHDHVRSQPAEMVEQVEG